MSIEGELRQEEKYTEQVPTCLPTHNFGSHKNLLFLPTHLQPSRLAVFCKFLPALGAMEEAVSNFITGTRSWGGFNVRRPSPKSKEACLFCITILALRAAV